LPKEEEKEERREAGKRRPPKGMPFAAKTGAPMGRSRTHHRRARLLPLHPCHCDAVFFFLADKHALPFFTDACATAFEDAFQDASAFEPRGNSLFALRCRVAIAGDAGLQARLGCFLADAAAFTDARATLPTLPCFL
jgi:hypothetical protein